MHTSTSGRSNCYAVERQDKMTASSSVVSHAYPRVPTLCYQFPERSVIRSHFTTVPVLCTCLVYAEQGAALKIVEL